MLAATAMQIAAIEASFPVRGAIRWTRQYHAMLATPLRVRDLVVGHLLYVATRVAVAARDLPRRARRVRRGALAARRSSRGPQSC